MTDAVVYVDIHVCTSQEARANGTFCGLSFASDESPPSENRFAGLRFQVAYVYITLFEDEHRWGDDAFLERYPIRTERYLTDVVNCTGKTGVATLNVLVVSTDSI